MKNYVKPVVLANEALAEGVYAASGGEFFDGCYRTEAEIKQRPETGRETYVIQFDAWHETNHDSTHQRLIITFNQPVTYVWSSGTLKEGDGTSTLKIDYDYHNNTTDKIGLGNLEVKSADGLTILGTTLQCNYTCDQHDHLGHY